MEAIGAIYIVSNSLAHQCVQRRHLEQHVGQNQTVEDITSLMLQSGNNWDSIKRFIYNINHSLEAEKRIRKAEVATSS